MKRKVNVVLLVFMLAGVATAELGDVDPTGLTGLWRFQDSSNWQLASIGTDLAGNLGGQQTGPWTEINPGLSDNGIRTTTDNPTVYAQVFHGIAPNGGGIYVNEYTLVMDYRETQSKAWNSLFQTAGTYNANDGDLFIKREGESGWISSIGIGAIGYSTQTFEANLWHRFVLSVDNSNFFRVYVDGTLFLDGAGQGVDGRFSLNPDFFLFADDSGYDEKVWGLVGTVAVWGRAMGSSEVADLGGWIGGAETPTPLTIVPEPATLALLALGGLSLVRRKR